VVLAPMELKVRHAINASVAAVGIPCLESTEAANLRISDGRIKSTSQQASVDAVDVHKAFVCVAAPPIRFAGRDLFVKWVAKLTSASGVGVG